MFTAAKKLIFSKLGIAVTSLIAYVTIVSQVAIAQPPSLMKTDRSQGDGPPGAPPRVDFVKALNLDESRATELRSILDDSMDARHTLMKQMRSATTDADKEAIHTKMQALHEATHKEIAALLTAEELAHFEKLMPKRRPPSNSPHSSKRYSVGGADGTVM